MKQCEEIKIDEEFKSQESSDVETDENKLQSFDLGTQYLNTDYGDESGRMPELTVKCSKSRVKENI